MMCLGLEMLSVYRASERIAKVFVESQAFMYICNGTIDNRSEGIITRSFSALQLVLSWYVRGFCGVC